MSVRASEPLRVVVRRGGIVEAVHRVHAVAVRDGEVVEAAGDPELVSYMRSCSKPIQALPLARARTDLDDRELAIACASHLADDDQLAAARSLLDKAPATEEELACGPVDGSRLRHNCSGKHAGMLALCRAHGWDSDGYFRPDHPVQRAMLAEHAALAELDEAEIPTATDGCGVVTYALPLKTIARAFTRFASRDGADRIARAMRAHPALIRGHGAPDTELMKAVPGWIAKGGAEGLLCAVSPEGLALTLKVEDGSGRPEKPALAELLRRLGHPVEHLAVVPLENSRGEVVGDISLASR